MATKKFPQYKLGETIDFIFIDNTYSGEIIEKDQKNECLKVKRKDGIVNMVHMSEAANKFCYVKNS